LLWSPQPGLVDDQGAVLASDRFAHLAIANPKLAPYGAAAMEVLRARGLAEKLAPRIVTGESIAQTFQFVSTGNAELGFVALSQVYAAPTQGDRGALGGSKPAGGSRWLVPQSLYNEIRQDAVLLKAGESDAAAKALLAYLKSPPAQDIIRSFGYGI
jgi:molybdate transport system substrate-binding protein